MNVVEARALRAIAAEPTVERLRADKERASHRIAPLVAHIAEHLFEPSLNYEQIRKVCRVRDNNRTTLFRHELGLTPAAYIRDCRMEVACRLLRTTTLDVAWIAELVGYGGPQVFTPSFKRYAGVTPSWYRRRERKVSEGNLASTTVGIVDTSPTTWRRLITAELTPPEARGVLRHVLNTYPNLHRELVASLAALLGGRYEGAEDRSVGIADEETDLVPSLRRILSDYDIESLIAGRLWESIKELPLLERLDALHRPLRFTTPALLDLIGEQVLAEVEVDPEAAVSTARLALEHAADLSRTTDDDGVGPYRTMAWIWNALARRKAGDPGAGKAFAVAERFLKLTVGASRRWARFQRLLDEAAEHTTDAEAISVGVEEAVMTES